MEIILSDPEKLPSSLWSTNLRVLPKLMSGHVIAYAGDLNFYHNILCFICRGVQFHLKKKQKKNELNSDMHNGFKQLGDVLFKQLGDVLQLKLIWPIKFKYSTEPLSYKC